LGEQRGFRRKSGLRIDKRIRVIGTSFEAPVEEIAGVEGNAEKVGWDKSKLRSADSDDANDRTVDRGHDPPLPQFSAN
jgi:hypothetical protein